MKNVLMGIVLALATVVLLAADTSSYGGIALELQTSAEARKAVSQYVQQNCVIELSSSRLAEIKRGMDQSGWVTLHLECGSEASK
jgi:hypothetical protein